MTVPDDLVGHGDERPVRRVAVTCSAPSRPATSARVVRAEVPQIEITRYAIDLRSFTHGAATFTRSVRALRADARQRRRPQLTG